MAVFLALSVGIAVGVSLRPSVDLTLNDQAAQDRKQVSELRAELDRARALDSYREAFDIRIGRELGREALQGTEVTLLTMPDAPTDVVQAVETGVTDAGGLVSRTVRINANAFNPDRAESLTSALEPFVEPLEVTEDMSVATTLGLALGRAFGTDEPGPVDELGESIMTSLSNAGMINVDDNSEARSELIIVVTAPAADPRPTPEAIAAHLDMQVALKPITRAVVLAGPNSESIEGTDVLAARNEAAAIDTLSTVDVADLASGVTTVVLAGKEQLLGRQGHYGALTKADAPLPDLPVR